MYVLVIFQAIGDELFLGGVRLKKKPYMPIGVSIMVAIIIIWSLFSLIWMFFYKDLSPIVYQRYDGSMYVSYDANKAPIKINATNNTSNNGNIQVTANGHFIFYIDSDGTFYKTKITNGATQKIAENITSFAISPYGMNVVYVESYNKLFSLSWGKKKLISDNVASTFSIGKSIFFAQGNEGNYTIYKITSKGNEEAVSNVWHFNTNFDSNAVTYAGSNNENFLLLENKKSILMPENVTDALVSWGTHTIYTIEDAISGDDGVFRGTLKKYNIANDKVSFVKDIATNVRGIGAVDGNNIAFNTDSLMLYNGSSSSMLSEANSYVLTFDNYKLYYIDYSSDPNGVLKTYENGKTKDVESGVSWVRICGKNKYYLKSGGLYLNLGNKDKLIDDNFYIFATFLQKGV